MEESSASVSCSFFPPLWARIAFGCFMFAVSGVAIWDHFYRFDWVDFLCAGFFFPSFLSQCKKARPQRGFTS